MDIDLRPRSFGFRLFSSRARSTKRCTRWSHGSSAIRRPTIPVRSADMVQEPGVESHDVDDRSRGGVAGVPGADRSALLDGAASRPSRTELFVSERMWLTDRCGDPVATSGVDRSRRFCAPVRRQSSIPVCTIHNVLRWWPGRLQPQFFLPGLFLQPRSTGTPGS